MGLALTQLHKLPGYQDAPRIWRQGVRVLDPTWVERAIRKFEATEEEEPAVKIREVDEIAEWFKAASDEAAEFNAKPNARRIILEVAETYGFTVAEIKGPSRKRSLVRARYNAIYETRRLCPHLSLPHIGRIFGGRDHSSIHYAINAWPEKAKIIGVKVIPLPVDNCSSGDLDEPE